MGVTWKSQDGYPASAGGNGWTLLGPFCHSFKRWRLWKTGEGGSRERKALSSGEKVSESCWPGWASRTTFHLATDRPSFDRPGFEVANFDFQLSVEVITDRCKWDRASDAKQTLRRRSYWYSCSSMAVTEIHFGPELERLFIHDRLAETSACTTFLRARREFFIPNCNIFSILSIFKCDPGGNKWQVYHSDVIQTSWKGKESDELLYTVRVTRYGPRTSCQREGSKMSGSLSATRNRLWYKSFER